METNYDYAESNGKGYYAYVGWLKEEWWDSPVKEQDIDWTDYDDELVAEAVEN